MPQRDPPQRRPRPRRSWRRRIAFSAVLFAGLTALGLVTIEAILRAQQGHVLGVPSQLEGMFTDYDGTVLTTPNWRGEHTVEGHTTIIAMNNLGMRGPDIPERKPPNERRVLVLGDSLVWGYGVAADETFAAVLESSIDGVRVGNGGAPGYGTRKSASALERVAESFRPDAIVFCINVGNDFRDDTILSETIVDGFRLTGPVARIARSSPRLRMALRFHVCYAAEKWLERNLPSLAMDRGEDAELPEERALTAALPSVHMQAHGMFMDQRASDVGIETALASCRDSLLRVQRVAGDAEVLVLVIPVWAQITEEEFDDQLRERGLDPADFERGLVGRRLSELCASLGIACIDLFPLLAGDDDPLANWQPVGLHFSVHGHRRVAEWIEPRVRQMLGR